MHEKNNAVKVSQALFLHIKTYFEDEINVEKCKVMHFGKSNPKEVYCMMDSAGNENEIEETNLEKLGCDCWK